MSVDLGTPNDVAPVPVVPLPNREGVVVVPPVDGGGFEVFTRRLPVPGSGVEPGVAGFAPKLNGLGAGAGPVEVVRPPNRPPPLVVFVVVPGVVEVVPKSEPAGLVPKMLPDVVVFVPVPVVPVPGVVLCVVPV